jgi:hypothetical protein
MRSRSVWLTASSLAAALLLASCGGDGSDTETLDDAAAPVIPSDVALKLADRSDEVAQKLDEGDSCGAGDKAAELRKEVTDAINAGEIPPEYLEELSGVANELEFDVPRCAQPPPPPPPPPTTTGEEGDGDD